MSFRLIYHRTLTRGSYTDRHRSHRRVGHAMARAIDLCFKIVLLMCNSDYCACAKRMPSASVMSCQAQRVVCSMPLLCSCPDGVLRTRYIAPRLLCCMFLDDCFGCAAIVEITLAPCKEGLGRALMLDDALETNTILTCTVPVVIPPYIRI